MAAKRNGTAPDLGYIAKDLRGLAIPIGKLNPDPHNARLHDQRNVEAIRASLAEFGQRKPVVVQKRGRIIRAGNGTLEAARALGWTHLAVVTEDDDDATATAFGIADNRTAELASWDDAKVAALLAEFEPELAAATGFDQAEIDRLVAEANGTAEVEEDDVPEPPANPVTKTGDVWTLGRHRVVCGDCRDAGAWPDIDDAVCLTDPPYGLGRVKASGKNDYDQHVDSRQNLEALAAAWLPIARSRCATVVFSPGITNLWIYPEADWVLSWFYGGGQLLSSWGFNCWQPFIAYGRDPSLATGHGGRPDAVNMNTPANAAEIDHPCPKPLALWGWFMKRLSFATHDVFVDPFIGSGTTLIAAEQLDRTCYGVEISPAYCDVVCQRWEALTGQKATR